MEASQKSTMSLRKPDASQLDCGCETRSIPGWPGYMVSEDGRVFSNKHRGVWKEVGCNKPNPSGYWMVTLRDQGRYRLELVHRLVMLSFVGPSPDGLIVRHINGNPRDNHLQNLAYGTYTENAIDKTHHGTQTKGENHPVAKLTEQEVMDIRQLKSQGFSCAKLAKTYHVTRSMISNIITGKSWSHLPTIPYKHLGYKHDDSKILSIRRRHKNGETAMQIAKDIDMNYKTVLAYIKYQLRKDLVPTESS